MPETVPAIAMTNATTYTKNIAMIEQPPKTRTLLGFDYGLKRIGVAVGQELTGTATALVTIRATDGKPDWEAISRLIKQWNPDEVVIGLPLNMDGTFHDLSYRAQRFGNQLHGRYNLRAHFMDERLSSLEAEHQLKNLQRVSIKNAGKKKSHKVQKSDIDKIAAKVILESWLDQQRIEKLNSAASTPQ
jgi:putative Holliday junction resolvase